MSEFPIAMNRRLMLAATSSAFAALLTGGCATAEDAPGAPLPLGPLRPDPQGLLDLPVGFSYRVLSRLGDAMSDGGTVPDSADGMGCFALADGRIALVRNHELRVNQDGGGPLGQGFDRRGDGAVLPGGTTTLVLDPGGTRVERQYRSLAGTIRNCAGGITPWGTWLTSQEDVTRQTRTPSLQRQPDARPDQLGAQSPRLAPVREHRITGLRS